MTKNRDNEALRPPPSHARARSHSPSSRPPPYPRPPERKVALVVGRHGVGLAIATELAKTMDVVITFGHDAEGAEKVAHKIQALEDVRNCSPSGAFNSKSRFSCIGPSQECIEDGQVRAQTRKWK